MVRHVLADVLDTKIVDHKGESDVFGGLFPKGRGPSDRGVAKLCKVYLESIVRDAARLFQAWYAFADIQVYPSVRWKLEEVVLGNDFLREYCQADFHILATLSGVPIIGSIVGNGNLSTIFLIDDGILGAGDNVINNRQYKCRE